MSERLRSWADTVWWWIETNWGLQPNPDVRLWIEFAGSIVGVVGGIAALVLTLYKLYYYLWIKPQRDRVRDKKLDEIWTAVEAIAGKVAAERYQAAAKILAYRSDEKSWRAFEALERRDTTAAKDIFEDILQTKAKESETGKRRAGEAAKEAAQAALHLAALWRVEDKEKAATYYERAGALDSENVDIWIELGDLYRKMGNLDNACVSYRKAVAAKSGDEAKLKNARKQLGDVLDKIGDKRDTEKNKPAALEAYEESRENRLRLWKSGNDTEVWRRDLAESFKKIGDLLYAQNNVPKVLKAFRKLAIANRLASADNQNKTWQRDKIMSNEEFAEQEGEGDLFQALTSFRKALKLCRFLAKDSSTVSVLEDSTADVMVAQGKLKWAQRRYKDALDIRKKLSADAADQLVLALLHDKLADVFIMLNRFDKELVEAAVKIREKLKDAIAEHADRAALHERIGDGKCLLSDFGGAEESYKAAVFEAESLGQNAGNDDSQVDLAGLREKFGDSVRDDNRLDEVVTAYRKSLSIRKDRADQTNDAEARLAEAKSHERLGSILQDERLGSLQDKTQARAEWERALELYRGLKRPRTAGRTRGDEAIEKIRGLIFEFEPLRQIGKLKEANGRDELNLAVAILRVHGERFEPLTRERIRNIDREIAALPSASITDNASLFPRVDGGVRGYPGTH